MISYQATQARRRLNKSSRPLADNPINFTDIVHFERTYNNTRESWALRINVTDLPVPDKISDLGTASASFSQGLRVANIQYELQWPGDKDSLQELLRERNLRVMVYTKIASMPSNITERFDYNDQGNCAAVLGDQCTQSLTDAASKDNGIHATRLERCESTLAVEDYSIATGSKIGENASASGGLEPS